MKYTRYFLKPPGGGPNPDYQIVWDTLKYGARSTNRVPVRMSKKAFSIFKEMEAAGQCARQVHGEGTFEIH